MAMVEIDENELAAMKRVTGFVNSALGNQTTRRRVLEIQKTLNPDTPIPELDASAPVDEAVKAVRAEMKALQDSLSEERKSREVRDVQDKAAAEWKKGRKLLQKAGWNDEGVRVIEDFMEKRGIADHEVAAAAYEKMHPAPEAPAGSGPARFDFFGSKDNGDALKPLFEGREEDFLRKMVPQALADARGGQVR